MREKLHITNKYLYYEKEYPSRRGMRPGIQSHKALSAKLKEEGYSGEALHRQTHVNYGYVYGDDYDALVATTHN